MRWADVIEAAAAYMARIHGWRNLHLYPGDDPSVLIPRIPRAVGYDIGCSGGGPHPLAAYLTGIFPGQARSLGTDLRP
ncbi:hypothetical protein [Streptomyces sp. NRRL S-813]|uniref:hypothetical protein n=1 Tax=Streptomyces sp. NRRL S-813 TaxID=1463919 RepID=UPI0004C12970|nr:hypothetical protein [Streptomyces sp. NRRL S-813]